MTFSRLKVLLAVALSTSVGLLIAVSPAAAAPPANDDFANAQTVGAALPVSVPASTVDATAEPGEPPVNSNPAISSIWFKWTAPSAGIRVVNLCDAGFTGANFPTERIAIRTSFAGAAVAEATGRCSLRFQSVLGVAYYIQIDYGNNQGDFTFRMRNLTPPPNDDFAAPTVVGPALPVSVNASNVDSTWEAGEPATLGGTTKSRSVWFSWTAPSSGPVRLDVCEYTPVAGPANRRVVVYTGNTLGTIVSLFSTNNCELDFAATAATTYRIAFSGYIAGEMDFTFRLFSAPPPANDDFTNATTVGPGLPVSLAGNNDFATIETGEPDHSGIGSSAHSVWYEWTPAASARVRIGACGRASVSSRVGVYTGVAVGALTQVAEQPGFSPHCRVVLNAVSGTTYRIAASGATFDGAHGPFTLDIHVEKLPPNDDFANAHDLGSKLPASIGGTTFDATLETNEPSPDPYNGYRNPSVWYRWTAPTDDAMIFSACTSGEPAVLGVFSGTELGDLTHIDGDDKGCPGGREGGRLAIAPVAGQVYSIVVESQDRDFDADFTFSAIGPRTEPKVTPPVAKPPATKPSNKFNLKKAIKKCRKIGKKKKRVRCIKKARKKAAVIKCRKKASKRAEAKCIKKARRKFR